MSSLLSLPKELRDEIWRHVFEETHQFGYTWSSCGFFDSRKYHSRSRRHHRTPYQRDVLRVCRQFCEELTPSFYDKVCVDVEHTNQTLRWLQTIGPRNSACIRHLVIRFSVVLVGYNEERHMADRIPAWVAALKCVPNLLSLNFDFQPASGSVLLPEQPDPYVLLNDTRLLQELGNSAIAWSKILQPASRMRSSKGFKYQPMRFMMEDAPHDVHHAVLAIDEEVPPPLVMYFGNLLHLSRAKSLDLPITGLPESFYKEQDLTKGWTYAFNNKTDRPSVTISYLKSPQQSVSVNVLQLGISLSIFPLRYLRIGCWHMNSTALMNIPPSPYAGELDTLDVAFTDTDPGRVVRYLQNVEVRCKKLYTLAIDVSPLHDRDPNDDSKERSFERESVSKEVAEKWQPFWAQLDQMSETGINVWEGEGPGFRRTRAT